MPINGKSCQMPSSRLTASTIASSAKCRPKEKDMSPSFEPIMSPTSNLTRSRSLRLPQKSPIFLNHRKINVSTDSERKQSELEKKFKELENELKEVKEINEFLASERTVLVDSLTEVEDNLKEVKESLDSLRLENIGLKDSLALKDEMINKLSAKYSRNRKVWEENERKATQEIKMLDDIVDQVIDTLRTLPETFRSSEQIQQLIEMLVEDTIKK